LSRVLSRFQGRLLTGPLAFLAAGLLDFGSYWLGALHSRLEAARRPGGESTVPPR
jgi:hypothetical protein